MSEPLDPARPRRLSARSTLFCRLILPLAWIAGLGAGALGPWLRALLAGGTPPPEPLFQGLFVVLWGVGSGFVLWFARPLRDVWIVGDRLRVRNFGRTLHLPLEAIEHAEESRHLRPKLVHLYPRPAPGRPERITFIPAMRRFLPLGPHPVIGELREAVARAAHGATSEAGD